MCLILPSLACSLVSETNLSLGEIDSQDLRLEFCQGSHGLLDWCLRIDTVYVVWKVIVLVSQRPVFNGGDVVYSQRSIDSVPRASRLAWQLFLVYSAELSVAKVLEPLMKPNLVARKISWRLPVRLNHFPSVFSLSP
jgi:hypothetical protein